MKVLGAVTAMAVLAGADNDGKAKAFIDAHVALVRPLEYEAGIAWWKANTTGDEAAFALKEQAQNKLDAALADKYRFAQLKAIRKEGVADPALSRQIDLLYLQCLEKQVDPELLKQMTAKANAIEKAFNVYRAKVRGEELADSKVRSLLKSSKDLELRKQVWEASKGVGAAVEADLKELVALRNRAAKALGFADFHVMLLALNEQEQAKILGLFDELDALTREPFLAAKTDIDTRLAASYGIKIEDLRPWHYHDPFFQEAPAVYATGLDSPYKTADILKLCRDFYAGIGLPIDDVIARSDLYEKKGKNPHAFCTDIDREGDVRVLGNIVPNEYWMGTMLHELGHAVYSSKNIPRALPYLLRTEAHILATEGVAMQFERFSKSADWLAKMGVEVGDKQAYNETGARMRRNHLLIFSRWCQVMLRFEKELYANPNRDLNALWWDLVEKYQGLKRPENRSQPDYASKIHIVAAPVYYHNYMMGELFACQVHEALAKELFPGTSPRSVQYVGDKRVGEFMKAKVFGIGKSKPWNELTRHATGADLNPKAFAAEFAAP